MTERKFLLSTLVVLLLVLGIGNPAFASYIADDYWGATPVNASSQDVIGSPDHFDISGMDVSLNGSNFNVKIYSNYFDSSYGIYDTQIGDLFLSTDGWNPNTDQDHYSNDNAFNGEDWEYVVVLEGKPDTFSSGTYTAKLYQVLDNGTIVLSPQENGVSWSAYRQGQEVWYNPADGQSALVTGNWYLNSDYLEINLDLSNFDIPDFNGFHWTYSCANDAIEGSVPLPPSLLLLGTGLVGLVSFRQKR